MKTSHFRFITRWIITGAPRNYPPTPMLQIKFYQYPKYQYLFVNQDPPVSKLSVYATNQDPSVSKSISIQIISLCYKSRSISLQMFSQCYKSRSINQYPNYLAGLNIRTSGSDNIFLKKFFLEKKS